MNKLGSFYLNRKKKYTKWGTICNWLITIIPILLISLTFIIGNKLSVYKSIDEAKENLGGGDGAIIFFWVIFFFFSIYLSGYKIIRRFWKPSKVREAWAKEKEAKTKRFLFFRKTNNKEDPYWGE